MRGEPPTSLQVIPPIDAIVDVNLHVTTTKPLCMDQLIAVSGILSSAVLTVK